MLGGKTYPGTKGTIGGDKAAVIGFAETGTRLELVEIGSKASPQPVRSLVLER